MKKRFLAALIVSLGMLVACDDSSSASSDNDKELSSSSTEKSGDSKDKSSSSKGKSSSSEAFLDAASPSIAVIQVGANNFYGHPHQQTIDRLTEREIPVYRTDLNGAVGIDIRRSRIRAVDTMR